MEQHDNGSPHTMLYGAILGRSKRKKALQLAHYRKGQLAVLSAAFASKKQLLQAELVLKDQLASSSTQPCCSTQRNTSCTSESEGKTGYMHFIMMPSLMISVRRLMSAPTLSTEKVGSFSAFASWPSSAAVFYKRLAWRCKEW